METLGTRISFYRNRQRYTQERLANEIGINQSTLSDIENDKISPHWLLIQKIAKQLDVPLKDILPLQDSIFSIVENNHFSDSAANNIHQYSAIIHQHSAMAKEVELLEELSKLKDELIQMKNELLKANEQIYLLSKKS